MAYTNKATFGSRKRWLAFDTDLQLAIIYSLVTAAVIFLPVVSELFIRQVLALGMVLFIPGYALVSALFPDRKGLDGLERLALSSALSIAVTPLIALGLNFTPWGIQLGPIVICLTALTIICAGIARRRRSGLKPDDRLDGGYREAMKRLVAEMFPPGEGRLGSALTLAMALLIIASIIMLAYLVITPMQGEKFTEFYILGQDGRMENYTTDMILGESGIITVGIVNHEYRAVPYDLVVRLNGSGNSSELQSMRILLQNGEKWEKPVIITPDLPGQDMKLDFLLYTDDNRTAPYRNLRLAVNVAAAGPATG